MRETAWHGNSGYGLMNAITNAITNASESKPGERAHGMRACAREGQWIRRQTQARDAVSGRLDIRTIPALRDRHWLPRKRRLPEERGACLRRREDGAARPAGMSAASNVIPIWD